MLAGILLCLAADIDWQSGFEKALELSKASGKPLVVVLDDPRAGC